MNHFRMLCVIGFGTATTAGAIVACSSDPAVTPTVDAGADVTVADSGKDGGGGNDAAADAVTEAAPPCPEAGATVKAGDNSGVQCSDDAGAAFCQKTTAVCCVGANGAKCAAKNAGCGAQATTFACDKASDCSDGGVCCLKNVTNPKGCTSQITTSEGTYCATSCTGSDVKMCNADPTACFNGTCTNLHLADAPGKVLSGCL